MDKPKFVMIVNRENRTLIRRLNGWNNPGPNHKKLAPGTMEKVGSNTFLFSSTEYALKNVLYLLGRHAVDLRIFIIEREMTFKEDFLFEPLMIFNP